MSQIKKKLKITDYVLIIIVLLLLIINLIIFLKGIYEPQKEQERQYNIIINETNTSNATPTKNENLRTTNEQIIKYLATLSEGARMEYYVGQYFNCINKSDYQGAYSLLYDEFKNKYFPTYNDYEKYAKEHYPEFFGLEYNDVSRQGNLYVVRVNIINVSTDNPNYEDYTRFVVKENYYNDFVMSFQVK